MSINLPYKKKKYTILHVETRKNIVLINIINLLLIHTKIKDTGNIVNGKVINMNERVLTLSKSN